MSSSERADQPREAAADIAIVGMAGRFPMAPNVEQFWRNLRDGVECITFFSDDDLRRSGAAASLLDNPSYVKARGRLSDIDRFDAAFFGYSPREAEITDPQQRLFLECAWEALEHAGYTPETYGGRIGVFAGATLSTYLLSNLYRNPELAQAVDEMQVLMANDKDYLSTRVSYKLNLKGPSINVNTACSTALVAVHLACQSLLNGECDIALAGGVSIAVPQDRGYLYREGGIHSPDGHCRAFDARAQGTVSGSGVGIVVLKPLERAIEDGDTIDAVIKGSAVNNDGALKIGFAAPSIEGQADVIAEALAVAAIDPATVGYVEAHGTGTPLGDPIEIAALNQVFRAGTGKVGFCALGSVKTNIGHLDAAAGAAGLIKAALALRHRLIPPSLHFHAPGPEIDLASSPFYVNTAPREWPAGAAPRRAGVSSFGIGGTNAHVVLEEAPEAEPSGPSRPYHLLLLSARSAAALDAATANLVEHLRAHPKQELADVAYTLQLGRKAFGHRRIVLGATLAEVLSALETRDPERVATHVHEPGARPVVFMFPGQGAQYEGMGRELYEHEPLFRAQVDRCAELLLPHLGIDLRAVIFDDRPTTKDRRPTGNGELEGANEQAAVGRSSLVVGRLDQTRYAQPALFVIEYALAKLWMRWGVRPWAMIGHSIGEYVAATLAGVFSLEDALALVVERGRLMQALPPGAMLAVPLAEDDVRPLLGQALALAAVNGPALCVVAGPIEPIDELERRLTERGIAARRLHTSHAFHSAMVEPIVEPFLARLRQTELRPPSMPFLSNVSGTWISAAQATDPRYWTQQLRQPVRFGPALAELAQEPDRVLLEVGPGRTLSTLARQSPERPARAVLSSLRHPRDQQPDLLFLMTMLGKLWLAGVSIDWAKLYAHERRRRVRLPTYPFERQRYWIDPPRAGGPAAERPDQLAAPPPDAEPRSDRPSALHPRPDLLGAYVAPGNEIERMIAAIWQEILGIEPVGIHDNFFELGGHSLMAIMLASRLREVFPVELALRDLFEATTVARLAGVIEGLLLEKLEELPEEEAERLLLMIADAGPAPD